MTTGQIATSTMQANPPRLTTILRIVAFASIVLGLLVSGYLTYVKATNVPMTCVEGGAFNCNVVQNSSYSMFFGVPIAYLGLATYIVLGALLLLEKRVAFLRENGPLLVFAIALFAWVYSMWLVYIQVAVLEALCPWCLAHEVNITVFFAVVSVQLWQHLRQGAEA